MFQRIWTALLLCLAMVPCASAEAFVEPLIEMEALWDIEDTRAETGEPLISRITQDGRTLGCDRATETFYCTLGQQGEEWPTLQLSLEGAPGVRAAWVDDYLYDSCQEAIAAGTRYELLVWNDTQRQTIGIVFTGLPIVTLDMVGGVLEHEDHYGWLTVSDYDGESADTMVCAHLRGRSYPEKFSARIELRKGSLSDPGKKKKGSLLGMPEDSDWLLMGNSSDVNGINSYVGWRIWSDFGHVLTPLQSRTCELFYGERYYGVYQLMQRIKADQEIKNYGGSKKTDLCARMVKSDAYDGDPVRQMGDEPSDSLEIRYMPDKMGEDTAFELFREAYHLLTEDPSALSDAEFEAGVLRNFDLENLMEEYIFEQAVVHWDNVRIGNNTYLWAIRQKDGTYRILVSPWDLDETVFPTQYYLGLGDYSQQYVSNMLTIERILDLDVGGAREILWRIWTEKRNGCLSDEKLTALLTEATDSLSQTGAGDRDLMRWHNGMEGRPDYDAMRQYVIDQQYHVEETFRERWPLSQE